MRSIKMIALVALLSSALSACVINVNHDDDDSNWQKREQKNREAISTLSLGIAEKEIRERLGEPDFSEGYSEAGEPVRVLFYRTQRLDEDGKTTKAECTPLVFKSGNLIGWGDRAYQRVGH